MICSTPCLSISGIRPCMSVRLFDTVARDQPGVKMRTARRTFGAHAACRVCRCANDVVCQVREVHGFFNGDLALPDRWIYCIVRHCIIVRSGE